MAHTGDQDASEKEELLSNVKREAKRLMEEAVTKKFVHADSSSVTTLCVAIDACVNHHLKKRIGGLLTSNTSEILLNKIGKYEPEASEVAKQCNLVIESVNRGSSPTPSNLLGIGESPKKKLATGNSGQSSPRYLWIRLALLDKVLTKIIHSLVEHCSEFYEQDAFIADQVLGPSLVWLLDGPCSLDYSKMKTPDSFWTDPSADELVLRHKIYSGTPLSPSLSVGRPQLFVSHISEAITGTPQLAREHVESLHQNAHSSLIFGKNNVVLNMPELPDPVGGYLSLHKCPESLLLKWTPNPMMANKSESDKSQYWDRVLTVDISDVVFIHWHHKGDHGGNVVLIGQDGLQLPPMYFPPGGALTAFLTCLEQGLQPHGRLDPPLSVIQTSNSNGPARKKISDKSSNEEQPSGSDSHDYVFRIISEGKTSAVDKKELQRLLSRTSPKKFIPPWKQQDAKKRNLIPKMHHGKLQRNAGVPARVSVQLAYDKMKGQILSRAFLGWLAHYRYLKTVRTHLASLVLPYSRAMASPSDGDKGLTEEQWRHLNQTGEVQDMLLLMKLTYYGGIEPKIRSEVWPYLLGHYLFGVTEEDRDLVDTTSKQEYERVLRECQSLDKYLREKEKDLLSLNGFGDGDTYCAHDDSGEINDKETSDKVDSEDFMSVQSKSLSSGPSTSDSVDGMAFDSNSVENSNELNRQRSQSVNTKNISLISSMIETKDSLREIVENASKRGQEAWRNLLKKSSQKQRWRSKSESSTLSASHDSDGPISFDLELSCNTCGKKIIESRQTVLSGRLGDDRLDIVECLLCSQKRKGEEENESKIMQEAERWTFRFPKVVRTLSSESPVTNPETGEIFRDASTAREAADATDFVVINGEDIHKRNPSTSSIESAYDEEVLKDFALNIHRIDKDVLRCDRNHPYFAQPENLEKLRNIMITYCWERLDIGYVQGMCDLCAPLLIVFDDEPKTYSCFIKWMDKMIDNFPHGKSMDILLANIQALIQILDPEMYEILHQHGDSSIFYFCYRWFLLDFKRELQYEDVFVVWETIWAAQHISSANFSLFVALAIIELYREIIIDNSMDFTDIIKFFNEMAERHDARAVLNLARNIVRKLQEVMHPSEIPIEV